MHITKIQKYLKRIRERSAHTKKKTPKELSITQKQVTAKKKKKKHVQSPCNCENNLK